MLRHYRRFWIFAAATLISAPLMFNLFAAPTEVVLQDEWRQVAPAPQVPKNWAALQALPAVIDAYLQDHFGLRTRMIRAQSIITHRWLGNDGKFAVMGRRDWLFYRLDEMIQQSAGLLIRDGRVDETADFLAALRDALAAQGTRFLVAIPPNSASIYSDMLPKWERNVGRPTEYDRLIADLKARGVAAVDLRPALKASRAGGAAYLKHDTHWSARGAMAGFNAIVMAAGHPNWRLDPAVSLGAPTPRIGGDLARMLGLTDMTEDTEPLSLPAHAAGAQPVILILGNSFTATHFPPMAQANGVLFQIIHHRQCGFDWSLVDQFHATEVWWMPTEQFMLCLPGVRPTGWPRAKAAAG